MGFFSPTDPPLDGQFGVAAAIRSILDGQFGSSGVAAWSPADLFAGGEGGYYFAESDSTTTFQDAARTTAAGDGDPLGGLTDLSGNGHHATQSTAAFRPTLTAASDKWYGVYDGTDDRLLLDVGSGIIKNSTGATFWGLIEDDAADTNSRLFQYFGHNASASSLKIYFGRLSGAAEGYYRWEPEDGGANDIEIVSGSSGITSPVAVVVTVNCTSGDGVVYYDGTQVGSENTTLPNFENLAEAYAAIGSYVNSQYWDGKISHVGCIDRVLTDTERANLDTWLSERAFA